MISSATTSNLKFSIQANATLLNNLHSSWWIQLLIIWRYQYPISFLSAYSELIEKYNKTMYNQITISWFLLQMSQRLYNLGARKVVMFEIGPLGCIPSIAKTHKHSGNCVESTNELASIFNDKLRATLANLTTTFQGSFFVLGRANWIGYDAITSPVKYGKFQNISCSPPLNYNSTCTFIDLYVYRSSRANGWKQSMLYYLGKWDFRVHSIA